MYNMQHAQSSTPGLATKIGGTESDYELRVMDDQGNTFEDVVCKMGVILHRHLLEWKPLYFEYKFSLKYIP